MADLDNLGTNFVQGISSGLQSQLGVQKDKQKALFDFLDLAIKTKTLEETRRSNLVSEALTRKQRELDEATEQRQQDVRDAAREVELARKNPKADELFSDQQILTSEGVGIRGGVDPSETRARLGRFLEDLQAKRQENLQSFGSTGAAATLESREQLRERSATASSKEAEARDTSAIDKRIAETDKLRAETDLIRDPKSVEDLNSAIPDDLKDKFRYLEGPEGKPVLKTISQSSTNDVIDAITKSGVKPDGTPIDKNFQNTLAGIRGIPTSELKRGEAGKKDLLAALLNPFGIQVNRTKKEKESQDVVGDLTGGLVPTTPETTAEDDTLDNIFSIN